MYDDLKRFYMITISLANQLILISAIKSLAIKHYQYQLILARHINLNNLLMCHIYEMSH